MDVKGPGGLFDMRVSPHGPIHVPRGLLEGFKQVQERFRVLEGEAKLEGVDTAKMAVELRRLCQRVRLISQKLQSSAHESAPDMPPLAKRARLLSRAPVMTDQDREGLLKEVDSFRGRMRVFLGQIEARHRRPQCEMVKKILTTVESEGFKKLSSLLLLKQKHQGLRLAIEQLTEEARSHLAEELKGIHERIVKGIESASSSFGMVIDNAETVRGHWHQCLDEAEGLPGLLEIIKDFRDRDDRLESLVDLVEDIFLFKGISVEAREKLMAPITACRRVFQDIPVRAEQMVLEHIETNYERVPQVGDGNCLFRSICQIKYRSPDGYAKERAATIAHMSRFRERFEPRIQQIMEGEYQQHAHLRRIRTVDQYLQHMARNGSFGDLPELQATAERWGVPVVVRYEVRLAKGERRSEVKAIEFPPKELMGPGDPIILNRTHRPDHYEAYVKKEPPPRQPKGLKRVALRALDQVHKALTDTEEVD